MTQAAADELVTEGYALFRGERFAEAAARFERAVAVFPQHAVGWKGLGHALLCLHKPHEAARAFDQAIGLRPDSATALWGGAVAHADIGNRLVAQNYLRRALALQPAWFTMALSVPQLVPLLQTSARTGELLRAVFGPFSCRTYTHGTDQTQTIEVGRLANLPTVGQWTFLTVGVSNTVWKDRPRVELLMRSTVDTEVCGQILANLGFHLAKTAFFPEVGTVVRDVIGALNVEMSKRLPHVYIQLPMAWNLTLPLDIGPPSITLAQVVPISDAEYQHWRTVGANRFERTLVERKVEIADLRRG